MGVESSSRGRVVAHWLEVGLRVRVVLPVRITPKIPLHGVVVPLHVRGLGHSVTEERTGGFAVLVGVVVTVKVVDVLIRGGRGVIFIIVIVLRIC